MWAGTICGRRIERVSQFSDERSRAVRLQILAGELKIHSSISETGESEETIPVEYDGPDTEIGFNAQYLLDFLKAVDRAKSSFISKTETAPANSVPKALPRASVYRYVIMPMRI